jgi:hypothetical protein
VNALCVNPSNTCDGIIVQAVLNVYKDQCARNRPPALDEMNIHFPAHFFQLFYTYIFTHEAYDSVGVEDEHSFREAILTGRYNPFMPDASTLQSYLNMSQLSFFDQDYLILNNAVIGVW